MSCKKGNAEILLAGIKPACLEDIESDLAAKFDINCTSYFELHEVLEAAVGNKYGLILAASGSLGLSDADLVKKLREVSPDYSDLPVIFISETGEFQKQSHNAIENDFVDYLFSPLSKEVLFRKISDQLNFAKLRKSYSLLKKREERLTIASEIINDGVWDWNFEIGDLYLSPGYFDLLGYSDDEFSKNIDAVYELIHPDDLENVEKGIEKTAVEGKPYSLEIRMKHKDGSWRWILSRARSLEGRDGEKATRIIGTHVDITDLKNTEIELRKNEFGLAAAQRIANMGSWELADGAEYMFWSDQAYTLFGYAPDEIVPTVDFLRSLVIPDDRHKIDSILSCSFLKDESKREEFRIRRSDGVIRHLLSVVSSDCHGDSFSGVFHGIFMDITESKTAEEHLIEQQVTLDSILTGIKAAFLIVDPDTMEILDSNEQASILFGLEKKDILATRCRTLLESDLCNTEVILGDDYVDVSGSFLNREITLKLGDDNIVPVSMSRVKLQHEGMQCFALIMFDITEKKSLERQLSFAQKLEAVGQLAAGIAHEINTPIQYIGGNLSYMDSTFEKVKNLVETSNILVKELENEKISSDVSSNFVQIVEEVNSEFILEEYPLAIKDSMEGVEQVASIVLAMKRFSHPDVEEKTTVNINEAIQNVVTVAKNEWKYASELEMDLSENIPLVMCNPGEINQAVLNVLVNAAHTNADKMKETGTMGKIAICTLEKNGFVEISISDTGKGIKEEDSDKIFDPFFTTKEVGKGTGQGLSITYSIMEKYGGSIDFKTKMGKGTVFTLRVPVTEID